MTTTNSYISDYQSKLEQRVLATYLFKGNLLDESNISELFMIPFHKQIYDAMRKSLINGKIDYIELYKNLDENESSIDYCIKLQESYVSDSDYQSSLSRMEDSYRKSRQIKLNNDFANGIIEYDEFIAESNKMHGEYIAFEKDDNVDIKSKINAVVNKNKILEFTEFKILQEKVKLIQRGLHIIAARPSVGKSAYALNLFNDLSRNSKYRCIYVNMEMTEEEIDSRLIGINTMTPIFQMEGAESESMEYANISNVLNEIYNRRNVKIINSPVSLGYLEKLFQNERRSAKNKDKHVIYFIDYLGYITSNNKNSDRERLGDIVRSLQIYTKLYDCTIFLLSQINRAGAQKPNLEALKDTGELEQSGHSVLIITDSDEGDLKNDHLLEVLVAKNRSGFKNGVLTYWYYRNTQKIKETTRRKQMKGEK